MIRIESKANPAYKALKKVKPGPAGPSILVEGEKLVEEALRAGLTLEALWSTHEAGSEDPRVTHLISAAMYRSVSPTKSGNPPLAVFAAPQPDGDFNAVKGRWLLLDRVQDPGNGGALVRAAAAFDYSGIIWLTPCVYPFHHGVIRASAGAVFHMKHIMLDAERAKFGSLPILGAGMREAVALPEFKAPDDFILAMGHEGGGLSPQLTENIRQMIRIPVSKKVESLNVAGAAHILMYELNK